MARCATTAFGVRRATAHAYCGPRRTARRRGGAPGAAILPMAPALGGFRASGLSPDVADP